LDKSKVELKAEIAKYEALIKRYKANHDLELANLRTSHVVEMKNVRNDHEKKFKDNHDVHTQQTDIQRTKYDDVVKQHEGDAEKRKEQHLNQLLTQKDNHDKAFENLQKMHVVANQESRNDFENAMKILRSDYEEIVCKLEKDL